MLLSNYRMQQCMEEANCSLLYGIPAKCSNMDNLYQTVKTCLSVENTQLLILCMYIRLIAMYTAIFRTQVDGA